MSANESSLLHYMTSMQESEQESSELAFFTARKLASDSDSDLDIVDFDEQPRATRAPTELLRVSKEQKD